MKKMILGAAALFMVFAMSSCNQAPTAELEKAQASMEAAKSVEADKYMAAEYTALNDSLSVIITAIESETAASSDFKPLAEKLNLITVAADSLKVTAEARKAEVRMQVESMLVELNTVVAAQKEMIGKIVVNAKNKEAVEAAQNEFAVVESTINEVNTLVSNGDYLTAMEKVTAAKEKATLVQTQLDAFAPKK